jgi:hypothetical protein
MPRFVILRHETPTGAERPTHFDLMLEWGQSLRTWACPVLPAPGVTLTVEELPPHRQAYLDYEGEVSAGRGRVTRLAAGEYDLLDEKPDFVRVRLNCKAISGELCLTRNGPELTVWTALFGVP